MNGYFPEQDVHDLLELHDLGENTEEESRSPAIEEPLNAGIPRTSEPATLCSCSEIVFWKCKLWMVIASVFLCLILVIIISLTFYSVIYTDEDEYWDLNSIVNGNHHNFSGILKIHCTNPDWLLSETVYQLLSENLSKRLTDLYSNSPALGRYFIYAEVISFSDENKTASFELGFSVPAESEGFMKSRMSETFVKNVLRQNIYDQEKIYDIDITDCTDLTLDPTSLSVSLHASSADE
ncbi:TPA-induced transmembrane protein isoform X1 [Sphaerodactylus townsendi]|uniref:TPA-induced transmembrane protein isoform X1 n=1 Tax=Sphaerodactylus townsendi TaxID=933632 RepID=UPI002026B8B0|nr:TPA-induced transmembrane protein isoform X1 [Sphaerodactylus townsendi]